MGQKDTIIDLTHAPYLRTGAGAKFLQTFGSALDELEDKMLQATLAHIPGAALTDTAIPYQAEDKLLIQGPSETNQQFIPRLQRAFDTWRKAGSREAILEELKAYRSNLDPGVTATDPSMLIVGGTSAYTTWDVCQFGDAVDAQPARRRQAPGNWNWDGTFPPWRAWLVLFMRSVPTGLSGTAASVTTVGGSGVSGVSSGFATLDGLAAVPDAVVGQWLRVSGAASSGNNGFFQVVLKLSSTSLMIANTKPGVAGDANNGSIHWSLEAYPFFRPSQPYGAPSFVWGSSFWGMEWADHHDITPQVLASIRQILRRWKSARTYYPYILVSFDGADGTQPHQFAPGSNEGNGNPGGDYGDYGLNSTGVWIPRAHQFPLTCFLDGTGQYLQCNVHNVT